MRRIRVFHFGCGPIGAQIAKLASTRPDLQIVGAADLDNAGKRLDEVAEIDEKSEVTICDRADMALKDTEPEIVLHATKSSLEDVFPQLEQILEVGANAVSTCEELAYPYRKHGALATRIDELARQHGVTVLGTGVNPGFVMDTWPLFMTGACQEVTEIKVLRVQDASCRRLPFQKKIGAGKTIEQFRRDSKTGILRHVGLPESASMIAAGLGWNLDSIEETIDPVVLDREVTSAHISVRPGLAAGVEQKCIGMSHGHRLITLIFSAHIGAQESYDSVCITGIPNIEVTVKGGINGDIATAAVVVNSIHRVINAAPGLITMRELPLVTAFGAPEPRYR